MVIGYVVTRFTGEIVNCGRVEGSMSRESSRERNILTHSRAILVGVVSVSTPLSVGCIPVSPGEARLYGYRHHLSRVEFSLLPPLSQATWFVIGSIAGVPKNIGSLTTFLVRLGRMHTRYEVWICRVQFKGVFLVFSLNICTFFSLISTIDPKKMPLFDVFPVLFTVLPARPSY